MLSTHKQETTSKFSKKHQHFIILLFIGIFMTFGCNQEKVDVVDINEEANVYSVEDSDKVMNSAIKKAKASFAEFEEHYRKNHDNSNFYYSLKHGFSTPDGGAEHMWINEIQYVDDKYMGVVNNEALYTHQVAYGDTVTIDKTEISDWMIINSETATAKGGYTIRAIREGMSPKEQQEFDMNFGLTFE